MEVLRLKRVEVTATWRAEVTAAQWSEGGSVGLLVLLAVHLLWDRKASLQSRWTHTQTDTQKDRLSHTSETIFEDFATATHFLFLNSCYFGNTVHLNVNSRYVEA